MGAFPKAVKQEGQSGKAPGGCQLERARPRGWRLEKNESGRTLSALPRRVGSASEDSARTRGAAGWAPDGDPRMTLARLLRRASLCLLAPRCLVCGEAGFDGLDLCPWCRAELPWNEPACTRCALPLAVGLDCP